MKVINKSIPFLIKMILCISLFLIFNNVKADGYNYASFNWEDFAEQFKNYWSGTCEKEEDSEKCVEQTIKSQKKFYTKLYKMLAKYERSGLYIKDEIIIATIYYGLNADSFRDDNAFYKRWFDKISFDFENENDEISIDDNEEEEGYTSLTSESNGIKILIKAMIGYEATCSVATAPVYEINGNNQSVPTCPQGELHKEGDTFTCKAVDSVTMASFGEKLLVKSGLTKFFGITRSEKHQECLNRGGTYTVANNKTVSEDAYWEFLKTSEYFDKKPHLQYRFSHIVDESGYKTLEDLESAMENDDELYNKYHDKIVEERQEIIDAIKYNLELFYRSNPESLTYFTSVDNKYYYPIGSTEITEENGKKFAKGNPVSAYIIKDYSPGSNEGIDIGSSEDLVNIISIKSGVVSKVVNNCESGDKTCNSGYGNMVVVSHSDGMSSTYAYLDQVYVTDGQSVTQGEVLGTMGTTGDTNEKALHFEIKISSGARVNPNTYISSQNPRPQPSTVGTINGGTKTQTVCLTLKEYGASDNGIAAIMSNINAESAFNYINLQNTFEGPLGHTDESYTAAVDNGTYTNFANDDAGYGLCQWTFSTRKAGLLNSAKQNGVSIGDPGNQISYLFIELKSGYSGLYNAIMSGSESVDSITSNFCHNFENPTEHTQCDTTRVNNARSYYNYVTNGCNS